MAYAWPKNPRIVRLRTPIVRQPSVYFPGPLAQLVEQRTFNPRVVGSIPTRPTILTPLFTSGLRMRPDRRVTRNSTSMLHSRCNSMLASFAWLLSWSGPQRLAKFAIKRQVRRKGRPALVQTFANKTLAREWGRKVEAELASSRFLRRVEGERHTLAEAIDRYIQTELHDLSEQEQRIRLTRLGWWSRRLGRNSLANLTTSAISEELARLLRKVSGPTSNRYLAALSAVLDRAEKEWEWVDVNPARKIRRRPEHRGRVRFLSESERRDLLAACRDSSDKRLFPLVLFAIATGARQGELLGLKWENVDVNRQQATLVHTKNGDRRSISFPGSSAGTLREMADQRERRLSSLQIPMANRPFPRSRGTEGAVRLPQLGRA